VIKLFLILILGDSVCAVLSIYSGAFLRSFFSEGLAKGWRPDVMQISVFAAVTLFASFLMEVYNHDKLTGNKEGLLRIIVALIVSFISLCAIYFAIPHISAGRAVLILSLCAFAFLQIMWHAAFKASFYFPGVSRKVLIIGTGALANQIGRLITSTNHNYYNLLGYVDGTSEAVSVLPERIMGHCEELVETAKRERPHKIVISLSEKRGNFPLKSLLCCKLNGIEIIDAPSFYEELTGKLCIENIKPSWFIFSDGFRTTNIRRFIKRLLDILLSVTGLLVALPFIPIIALAIRLDSRGPVFFTQVRVGEGEKGFILYKFRSMFPDAESETGAVWAAENDKRVTSVGKVLRKTRLDEIPQLFNVLRGDMSFIGPRPERPEFVERLKSIVPYYSERHFVKPGITGWAQVKHSYGASVEDAIEKLRYDLFYLKHFSLFLDLLILLETTKVVLFGRGGR
jgi:sugar transferase (PEP-CTERM system associated)